MKHEISPIEQIKILKSKLENREMSALIGAGFSKNISEIFPSWWELLYDIADFLFGKEIKEEYLNLRNKKSIKREDYFNKKIGFYINKIGYLELVSMYLKQKGYREAITTYIEEKTPKIIIKNKKKYLINKLRGVVNEIELTCEMLTLHKALINLPWNNIYTTNYDEMLEEAIDSSNEESLLKIKDELANELIQLQNKKNNLVYKKKELDISKQSLDISKNSESISSQLELERIPDTKNEIGKIVWDIEFNETRTKDIEKELIDIQKAIIECINVVTHSSQLSIKRNKNIIKVHGTLRKDNEHFGFDNDTRKHYIIAKEDYETYPQEHEAFTQLMRISLLQESYCLIGFSGMDPNFIEWIKWVRDILEKGDSQKENFKIYLIEVGDTISQEDIKLFYENYL